MTDDTGSPYPFDFLETIVGISFPSQGGYVLITVTAIANATGVGAGPPPPFPTPPKPVIALGAGEKLIDQTTTVTQKTTKAKTGTSTVFFVFNSVAGPVTPANYQNVINSSLFPPVLFATQFALVVGSPTGFKSPEAFGVEPVPEGGSGFFSTAAIAQGYASSWNAHIKGAPAGSGVAVFLSDGSTLDANPAPVSVSSVTTPTVTPAVATTTSVTKYLVKVPLVKTTLNLTVTTPQGQSDLTIFGFHGTTPKKVAQTNPVNSDSGDEASLAGTKATYTVTSEILRTGQAKQGPLENTVTVKVAGGGGAG